MSGWVRRSKGVTNRLRPATRPVRVAIAAIADHRHRAGHLARWGIRSSTGRSFSEQVRCARLGRPVLPGLWAMPANRRVTHSMLSPNFVLRSATLGDLSALETLIALSARTLGARDYSPAQIEGALRGAFGVDTQLIRDGTYFVVQYGDQLVGCGGWSRRRTLFGGDARPDRDASELDPRQDAAKIRAFFVHPEFARRGIGESILERCEQEALAQGFTRF